MEELITELIEFVKNVSPELWRIAIRQVYAQIVFDIFLFVVFVVWLFVSLKYLIPAISKKIQQATGSWSNDFDVFGPILILFIGIADTICAIWSIYLVYEIVMGLVNPEYAAIQKLMYLLPK